MTYIALWGAALVAMGLAGLLYCIVQGFRIRGGALPEDAVQPQLQKLVAVNLGSVACAAMGLAILLAGLLL